MPRPPLPGLPGTWPLGLRELPTSGIMNRGLVLAWFCLVESCAGGIKGDDCKRTGRNLSTAPEQLLRGELEEEEFKTEVDQLRFQDDLGNRWKIGWYTGKWYRYDQGQWVQGEPRDRLAQAAPLPAPDVAPGKEGKQQGRSRAAYLVIALIALLLLASVALIFGWNQDREGKPEEDTPAGRSSPPLNGGHYLNRIGDRCCHCPKCRSHHPCLANPHFTGHDHTQPRSYSH